MCVYFSVSYEPSFIQLVYILVSVRNLPSKSPEEELRHRQEYEAMVEAAKKKGQLPHRLIFQAIHQDMCEHCELPQNFKFIYK